MNVHLLKGLWEHSFVLEVYNGIHCTGKALCCNCDPLMKKKFPIYLSLLTFYSLYSPFSKVILKLLCCLFKNLPTLSPFSLRKPLGLVSPLPTLEYLYTSFAPEQTKFSLLSDKLPQTSHWRARYLLLWSFGNCVKHFSVDNFKFYIY